MGEPFWIACSIIALVIGPIIGYGVAFIRSRSQLQGIRIEAEAVARQARDDADKIKKEAELKARDELYSEARGAEPRD